MLNYIWVFMIIIGIVYGSFTGQMAEISNGVIDSSKEAVQLCITMLGVVALWTGIMEIAKESGLVASLTKGMRPFLKFLFPRIPKEHPAMSYISLNCIANILGLGWAATPAGLKAMEELAKLEEERGTPGYASADGGRKVLAGRDIGGMAAGAETTGRHRRGSMPAGMGEGDREKEKKGRTASNEMCTFLILNISSLQLIPVNMIAYRSQYGSVNPAGIIAPAIVATSISTLIAVVYCKVRARRRRV